MLWYNHYLNFWKSKKTLLQQLLYILAQVYSSFYLHVVGGGYVLNLDEIAHFKLKQKIHLFIHPNQYLQNKDLIFYFDKTYKIY